MEVQEAATLWIIPQKKIDHVVEDTLPLLQLKKLHQVYKQKT